MTPPVFLLRLVAPLVQERSERSRRSFFLQPSDLREFSICPYWLFHAVVDGVAAPGTHTHCSTETVSPCVPIAVVTT